MKENKKNYNEEMEDVTKYGEFVTSYFAWISLRKQKDRTKELENMTDKKEDK